MRSLWAGCVMRLKLKVIVVYVGAIGKLVQAFRRMEVAENPVIMLNKDELTTVRPRRS